MEMYNGKKTAKITCHLFWKYRTKAEHPPHPPVYAFKCLLPVSSEMKGKVVCNASALSVSHLISCSTHSSDFSGQSSAKAVFFRVLYQTGFSVFLLLLLLLLLLLFNEECYAWYSNTRKCVQPTKNKQTRHRRVGWLDTSFPGHN